MSWRRAAADFPAVSGHTPGSRDTRSHIRRSAEVPGERNRWSGDGEMAGWAGHCAEYLAELWHDQSASKEVCLLKKHDVLKLFEMQVVTENVLTSADINKWHGSI